MTRNNPFSHVHAQGVLGVGRAVCAVREGQSSALYVSACTFGAQPGFIHTI
jgi:hypothetical protein